MTLRYFLAEASASTIEPHQTQMPASRPATLLCDAGWISNHSRTRSCTLRSRGMGLVDQYCRMASRLLQGHVGECGRWGGSRGMSISGSPHRRCARSLSSA